MSPTILAAALILSRIHGEQFALSFLLDKGIDAAVAKELLADNVELRTSEANRHRRAYGNCKLPTGGR